MPRSVLKVGLALVKEFISSFFFRKRKKQRPRRNKDHEVAAKLKLVADVQFMRFTHQT
jgi:hypothetical protein